MRPNKELSTDTPISRGELVHEVIETKIQLAKETLLGNRRAIKEDLDSCFNGCWTFSSNLPPWTFVNSQTCQGHPFAVDNTTKALEEQKKKVVEKSETARGLCRST